MKKEENPYNREGSSLLSPGDVLIVNKNYEKINFKKGAEESTKGERVVVTTDAMEIEFGYVRMATQEETDKLCKGYNCKDFITLDRNVAKTGLSPQTYLMNPRIAKIVRESTYELEQAMSLDDVLEGNDIKKLRKAVDFMPYHIADNCYKVLGVVKNPYGETIIPF